jgi:sulfatase modifying factor 1
MPGQPSGPAVERGQSCADFDQQCGADGLRDCCALSIAPTGEFNRLNDPNAPAKVSQFFLDTFEVTVARMRAFVDSGYGTREHPPASGSGAHPSIEDSGWRSSWDDYLPASTSALRTALACTDDYPVWTDARGSNDNLPINCVDWYLAFAFCIWDGSRLPTDAEWNYAAAGGSEQRPFPWGSAQPDSTLAAFDCEADGEPRPSCSLSDLLPVGVHPDGAGLFGNADLGGNIMEWTLDTTGEPPPNCNDCANLELGTAKNLRGGSFTSGLDTLRTSFVQSGAPNISPSNVGFRCARTPTP